MSKILYGGLIIIAIVVIVIGWGIISEPKVNVDNLAECLTEKGVIMAGTDTCAACQEQKRQFGDAFDKINYKNCDYEGEWCKQNNITGFPTWVFPDRTYYRGVQNLGFLQQVSGCELYEKEK